MQIKYKDVVLRDYRESDIEDEVRWNTVDTDWGLWDAPWEKEEHFRTFDPEAYRQRRLDWLGTKAPKGEELRWFLEIDTAQGVHIGTVRAYRFDAAACSCEVSYALNSAFQGCGYMREALGKLADICFDEVRVGRIVARIDEENAASAHVARRLGMKLVRDGDFVVPIKGEERIQHTYVLGRRP